MSFVVSCIPRCGRVCLALLALTATVLGAATSAQGPVPTTAQIAELERAVAQYEAAAKIGKPDQQREMQYLLSMVRLATLYMQVDRIQESWPLQEKVLARFEQLFGPDHPNIVSQLEANASSYGLQGRYAEAEKLRKRAIAINEHAFGADSLDVAISQQGMANLFRLQERYDEALPFATRALEIADRKLPAADPRRANFLSEVANIHMSARRYDAAEPLLKQALAIVEGAKSLDPVVASARSIQYLQSLGLANLFRARHAEGRSYIDRAIAISTQRFGPDHTITSAMLMTLALQLDDQNQLEEAERLYKQALPLNEKHGRLRAELADNYVGLGLVEFKRKNWPEAYKLLRQASTISIEIEQVAMVGRTSTANRVAPRADIFLLHAVAAYRTAEMRIGDVPALTDDAFQMAQRAERSQVAVALAQMAARVSAGTGPLGKVVRDRQDLAIEWQRLDKLLETALTTPQAQRSAADEQRGRRRMAEISAHIQAIDAQVARDFPDFAKLSDPAPLSISDVQHLLAPNEVMIVIANRLNQSLVWAISRDAVKWDLVPVGEEELTREIAALRCGLDETAWQDGNGKTCAGMLGQTWVPGAALPYDLGRAHALYKAVLGPFGDMTEGKRLLVATSGPIAGLPLHVLVTDPPVMAIPKDTAGYAGAAWLAKRNALANLPSVSSLKSLRTSAKASRAERPYLGIANPLLDGPDARYADRARGAKANRTCAATVALASATAAARRLDGGVPKRAIPPAQMQGGLAPVGLIREQMPLPETADEVCAVAKDFGAGEADIRLAERATETEIKRLSANGELAKYRIVHFATHGALAGQISNTSEAGLLLTPPATGSTADDGYLTAPEITELKLDADWVILSACNTASVGKVGAETLSGLARAFFYAQARTLLVSHWEVNSDAAVRLITAAAGETARDPTAGRSEALRKAMLGLIDHRGAIEGHPSYWAPFVVVGEGGSGR